MSGTTRTPFLVRISSASGSVGWFAPSRTIAARTSGAVALVRTPPSAAGVRVWHSAAGVAAPGQAAPAGEAGDAAVLRHVRVERGDVEAPRPADGARRVRHRDDGRAGRGEQARRPAADVAVALDRHGVPGDGLALVAQHALRGVQEPAA